MSPRKRAATPEPVDFRDELLKALSQVDRPGDFCTGGNRPLLMPGLEVDGMGGVGLPLTKVMEGSTATTIGRNAEMLRMLCTLRDMHPERIAVCARFVTQVVLVLSATVLVLVLVLERTAMTQPTFDHERLDVYRLSIEYGAFSYRIAKGLSGINRPARDQWLRAAQSIPLSIAEGNGKQSLKDRNRFFEIARGSALECAAIHDALRAYDAIDEEAARCGKSNLKRIVSMLTRLIQRKQTTAMAEEAIEYEYRDAEHEYEPNTEN